jgi:hypothetical protein
VLDVGGVPVASGVGEEGLGAFDLEEAEEGGGVDEGEQVVNLELQVVGQVGQVGLAVVGVDDLDQAGQAADGRLGQGVGERAGDGGSFGGGLLVASGEDGLEPVDHGLEGGGAPVAGAG